MATGDCQFDAVVRGCMVLKCEYRADVVVRQGEDRHWRDESCIRKEIGRAVVQEETTIKLHAHITLLMSSRFYNASMGYLSTTQHFGGGYCGKRERTLPMMGTICCWQKR